MATSKVPTAGGRTRALRIGVLLGGKIVEERLIRERADVTIGQSAKATFSIPLEELPRQWAVFELKNDRYVLNFTAKMDGRVSDGDRVLTLEQARSSGAAKVDDHWSLPLSSQARGKISLGELTLLFQFVSAPPIQPRPQLPHSVRGTFVDRIDPRLSVIVAASLAVHFGLMLYAVLVNDPETNRNLAETAFNDTFKDDTYTVQDFQLPEPPKADTGAQPAPEVKKPEKPETPRPDKPKPAAGGTENKPDRDAAQAVALKEESVRYADMLFSDDDTSATGLAGGMERRKPGNDLDKELGEVAASGARTEIGGGTVGRGTRGGGDPRMGTSTGPAVQGPTGPVSASGPDRQEKVPEGRINVSDKKSFDDSTLTPDAVLRKIQNAYMSGIKRCQKATLLKDPTARGKVKLNFTVNATGKVVSPKANGFDPDLDSCITSLMGNWRFDIPKDSDGEATDASFEIGLMLVPE
ncbi:MAG TPA: AgmX/PglI C-terminal domain-containing protein [Kofleriaceae bacterium]|nr:AgmX/PglI C-terminal domain-containing protein [Kofleriaceae bacterium]